MKSRLLLRSFKNYDEGL